MSTEITEERYRKLKRDVEQAKAEADRAEGALTQLLHRLKEEFECDTVKEAKSLLTQLESKRDKAKKAFETALEEYEEKWKKEPEPEE